MLRVLAFLFLSVSSLQDSHGPYAHISDVEARKIIKASIEHAGGLERWENVKHLKYKKDFHLFDSSGEKEKIFEQVHDYNYKMDHILVQSFESGVETNTSINQGIYSRTKSSVENGVKSEEREDDQVKLAKAMNTSLYVVSMPFKLIDPGAEISYEGKEAMEDGRVVDVVKVVYNAEKYENHSSSEIWKYYFDEERKIVANWIQSSDHLNIVENLSFIRAGGILFNGERKSWRIDEQGNKLYLRAEYLYYDYIVE